MNKVRTVFKVRIKVEQNNVKLILGHLKGRQKNWREWDEDEWYWNESEMKRQARSIPNKSLQRKPRCVTLLITMTKISKLMGCTSFYINTTLQCWQIESLSCETLCTDWRMGIGTATSRIALPTFRVISLIVSLLGGRGHGALWLVGGFCKACSHAPSGYEPGATCNSKWKLLSTMCASAALIRLSFICVYCVYSLC